MILRSCDYRQLNCNCPVISSMEFDGAANVKIPCSVAGYQLYDVLDVSKAKARTVCFDGVEFDGQRPWVDIPWINLNREAGQHVYKLSFMNKNQTRFVTKYFAYIVQDSNPDKPFIYMEDKMDSDEYEKSGRYL